MPPLDIPPALKELFDRFPFTTYQANAQPISSPQNRHVESSKVNVLYVWISEDGARKGLPSFNPTCLKTQTYLRFLQVDFALQPSVNHASPTGSLPFVLTPNSSTLPIRNSKLFDWARTHSQLQDSQRQSAKQVDLESVDPIHSVLDNHLRPAYLHALYLNESTAAELAQPLYVGSTTRNWLVRKILEEQLRHAAQAEIAASGQYIGDSGSELLTQAALALGRLDARLGRRLWFSSLGHAGDGQSQRHERTSSSGSSNSSTANLPETPALLDAAVFSYMHVILSLFSEQDESTAAGQLYAEVSRHGNLVAHHRRIIEAFYT